MDRVILFADGRTVEKRITPVGVVYLVEKT